MRAAIYARISADKTGAGLGVERQVADCEELAAGLNARVVATFSDNDLSAFSGKQRPGYDALLGLMKSGEVDTVIAWHTDRLHRSMVELEAYVLASEPHGIPTYTVKAGLLDLATPSGRLVARQLGAVARYEVEHAIERQKAAKLQAAKAGKWGGGLRPYGYAKDGMTVIEEEAAIVRELTDRFIAGDSWRTLAIDLNERGILTSGGKRWNAAKTKNVATRLRNVGIREHNGDQYPAAWPAIVTRKQWDDLHTAIALSRAAAGRRGKYRKYLLKGFAFCGNCGNELNSYSKQNRNGTYSPSFRCRTDDLERGKIGCGRISRRMEPLEHLITEAVFYRLDTEGLATLLAQAQGDSSRVRDLLDRQRQQDARLQEIVEHYSAGRISFDEYQAMKTSAQAEQVTIGKQLEQATAGSTLDALPLDGSIRAAWEVADLGWKRQLLDLLLEKVYIDPAPRTGGYTTPRWRDWFFDTSLIRVEWKV